MIHIIQGDGKGKTTAAVGASVRVVGRGWNVLFVQFLKDDTSGEIKGLKKLGIDTLHSKVDYGFLFSMTEEQKNKTTEHCFELLDQAIYSNANMIVLDEILVAINEGLISDTQFRRILEKKCEIVLTGRKAPDWLIEKADYISE